MKNKGLLIGILGLMGLLGSGATAQNGFNLPYTQFGLGLGESPYNMPAAARMGGTVLTRAGGNSINPFNPASYGDIATESFVFDMGLNIQLSTLRSGDKSVRDADGNIGYLAIGLPITKWWKVAAGLMPYSTVDYESVDSTNVVKTTYAGTGGVNELFAGSAFCIPVGTGRSLEVGFNAGYLTGSIQRGITYNFAGGDTTYYIDSRKQKDTRISNVVFDFGLRYRQPIGERYTLCLGLSHKPYQDMSVKETALIYTFRSISGSERLFDTIFPARGDDAEIESRIEQPHTYGVGLSLERNGVWQVAADATFSAWQGLRYTEDESHRVFGDNTLGDGAFSRYAVGFEKMGVMDASTYWGRISWSIGAHAEQGVLYLNTGDGSRRIDQWGVGAGMSLPMRKGRSLLSLSVGYNCLGDADLLQRNTVTFGIAVSSCEKWFAKRKYN